MAIVRLTLEFREFRLICGDIERRVGNEQLGITEIGGRVAPLRRVKASLMVQPAAW
jgi:hypothetical protein